MLAAALLGGAILLCGTLFTLALGRAAALADAELARSRRRT